MSQIFSAAGALVDRIKINAVSRECRDGRALWIKRRRWTARPIMACANRFFRLAGNPIQALDELAIWQRWEVDCFLQLHGGEFQAFAEGACAVAAEEVPGKSLSHHLSHGTLSARMLEAAARELRRAHEAECATFHGPWSHGDPHSGNFVYEPSADRARLIDFEVMHHPTIGADERHADDLLIFLQDLVGRISIEQWMPSARAFLSAYDRQEIVVLLRQKLFVPRGLPRVWWAVRTTYLGAAELERRLRALRESI
ncbi:MAG: hypothetical protein ABJF10_28840 [Chthoniobacter sp.]|uniref:hypothetical protein n=1 Tax=Chthoniobacter sp. TaxID=2510640 RepID=UPI0032A97B37